MGSLKNFYIDSELKISGDDDLMKAFGNNTKEAIKHFISFVMPEDKGTYGFNANPYLNN